MESISNLLFKFLCAIATGGLYTLLSFVITHGIYRIKGKELPDEFIDIFGNLMTTNVIICFFILLFFKLEG